LFESFYLSFGHELSEPIMNHVWSGLARGDWYVGFENDVDCCVVYAEHGDAPYLSAYISGQVTGPIVRELIGSVIDDLFQNRGVRKVKVGAPADNVLCVFSMWLGLLYAGRWEQDLLCGSEYQDIILLEKLSPVLTEPAGEEIYNDGSSVLLQRGAV
jgi:hypothetical protein